MLKLGNASALDRMTANEQRQFWRYGVARVPQDARITSAEHLGHIMSTAGIRVVLTLAQHVDRIPIGPGQIAIPLDTLALDALKYDGSIPLVSSPGTGGPTAVVIFTSGTTSRSNGIAVTHANLCNALLTEPESLGIQLGMRVAQLLNIAVDMGGGRSSLRSHTGGTLVIRGSASHNVKTVAAVRPTNDGLVVERGALRGLVTADH